MSGLLKLQSRPEKSLPRPRFRPEIQPAVPSRKKAYKTMKTGRDFEAGFGIFSCPNPARPKNSLTRFESRVVFGSGREIPDPVSSPMLKILSYLK